MTWLNHRRLERALSAYLDGELDAAASANMTAHLRDCWGCSGEAELLRLVKRSLRNLGHRHSDVLGAARLRRLASRLTS